MKALIRIRLMKTLTKFYTVMAFHKVVIFADSDSASLSSNASSTIVKKTEKGSVAKPKIKVGFKFFKVSLKSIKV